MPTRDEIDTAALTEMRRTLTNHTPDMEKIERIEAIRNRAKLLGSDIIFYAPPSRSRSLALTALEDCVMRAVQAIVIPQDGE